MRRGVSNGRPISPDKATQVHQGRSGWRKINKTPEQLLLEARVQYLKDRIDEGLLHYSSPATQDRGWKILHNIAEEHLADDTLWIFLHLVFLSKEVQKRKWGRMNLREKYERHLAALDEISIRKELNVREKRSLSFLWLFPPICECCPRELLEKPAFHRLVLDGFLTDPDGTLAARVLCEGFVILNRCYPGETDSASNSRKRNLNNATTTWSVIIYHRFCRPIFQAITLCPAPLPIVGGAGAGQQQQHRPGSPPVRAPPGSSSASLRPPRAQSAASLLRSSTRPSGRISPIRARNLRSPRGDEALDTITPTRLHHEQLELQCWNGSLALICLTRELLLQYSVDTTRTPQLRELLMENACCVYDNLTQVSDAFRKKILADVGEAGAAGAVGDVKEGDEDNFNATTRSFVLENNRISNSSMTRGRMHKPSSNCTLGMKKPGPGTTRSAKKQAVFEKKMQSIAQLGLLHCVGQYLAAYLWPRRYLLQIAAICVHICRKAGKYTRDLCVVACVCLTHCGSFLMLQAATGDEADTKKRLRDNELRDAEKARRRSSGRGSFNASRTGFGDEDGEEDLQGRNDYGNNYLSNNWEDLAMQNHAACVGEDCLANILPDHVLSPRAAAAQDVDGDFARHRGNASSFHRGPDDSPPREAAGSQGGDFCSDDGVEIIDRSRYGNRRERGPSTTEDRGYPNEQVGGSSGSDSRRRKGGGNYKQAAAADDNKRQPRQLEDESVELLLQLAPVVQSLMKPETNPDLFQHMRGEADGRLRKCVDSCYGSWKLLEGERKKRRDAAKKKMTDPVDEDYEVGEFDVLDDSCVAGGRGGAGSSLNRTQDGRHVLPENLEDAADSDDEDVDPVTGKRSPSSSIFAISRHGSSNVRQRAGGGSVSAQKNSFQKKITNECFSMRTAMDNLIAGCEPLSPLLFGDGPRTDGNIYLDADSRVVEGVGGGGGDDPGIAGAGGTTTAALRRSSLMNNSSSNNATRKTLRFDLEGNGDNSEAGQQGDGVVSYQLQRSASAGAFGPPLARSGSSNSFARTQKQFIALDPLDPELDSPRLRPPSSPPTNRNQPLPLHGQAAGVDNERLSDDADGDPARRDGGESDRGEGEDRRKKIVDDPESRRRIRPLSPRLVKTSPSNRKTKASTRSQIERAEAGAMSPRGGGAGCGEGRPHGQHGIDKTPMEKIRACIQGGVVDEAFALVLQYGHEEMLFQFLEELELHKKLTQQMLEEEQSEVMRNATNSSPVGRQLGDRDRGMDGDAGGKERLVSDVSAQDWNRTLNPLGDREQQERAALRYPQKQPAEEKFPLAINQRRTIGKMLAQILRREVNKCCSKLSRSRSAGSLASTRASSGGGRSFSRGYQIAYEREEEATRKKLELAARFLPDYVVMSKDVVPGVEAFAQADDTKTLQLIRDTCLRGCEIFDLREILTKVYAKVTPHF